MKRIRRPKCENYITFDEKKYKDGQSLVFVCPSCGKQFGIRIGLSKLVNVRKEDNPEADVESFRFGYLTVIENVFHFKQIIPLCLGMNVIGRHMKGYVINCPIETVDPSVDLTHCRIMVRKAKNGHFKYLLSDGPSNTGTFVGTEILGDREKRVIHDGTIFTLGATSIILHEPAYSEEK